MTTTNNTEIKSYSIYFSHYECVGNAKDEYSSPTFEEMFEEVTIDAQSDFHAGMMFQQHYTVGTYQLTVLSVTETQVTLIDELVELTKTIDDGEF